ncbi:MAG: hypothetical protein ABI867_01900 [Kofleriaceae bacterium]
MSALIARRAHAPDRASSAFAARLGMPNPTQPKQPRQPEKLAEPEEDNVVRKELSKGDVRPDGPGDETAPVAPERPAKH